MSFTTHCIICSKDISYSEESFEGKPEFCSTRCSRKAFHRGYFEDDLTYEGMEI